MPNHELTREDRAKGAVKRGEAIRARRAAAEERAIERMADKLEAVVDVYTDAMVAESSTVVRDGDTITEPDHRVRIQGADRIADRVMGKAVQRTELTGAGGGPVVVENDVNADDARAILRGLADHGLVRPGDAQNGHAAADEIHSA